MTSLKQAPKYLQTKYEIIKMIYQFEYLCETLHEFGIKELQIIFGVKLP